MNNKRLVSFMNADDSFFIILSYLIEGKCGCILPLSVTRTGDAVRGIYDTTGYRKLSVLRNIKASDILEVLAGTVQCMEMCRNFLLFSRDYILSPDNVYVSEDYRKVKFIIVPAKPVASDVNSLLSYIHSLKPLTNENGRIYLETMSNILECENLRCENVTAFIRHLQKEISLCSAE